MNSAKYASLQRRFSFKTFGIWLLFSAVLAIALCPFALWLSAAFTGNLTHAANPILVYTSLDLDVYIANLMSCLTVPDNRLWLIVIFVVIALVPFLFDNGSMFFIENREVKGSVLADQQVYDKKREVLERNYTWNGTEKPPVYGLAMGGYSGCEIIIPATHAAIVAPSGSGKTRGSVYQTIDNLSYGAENTLIVCDPSGEIYAMMGEGLSARGYGEPHLLDLNDGKRGDRYNPLQLIAECYRREDFDSAEARSIEIGGILSPEQGTGDDYFNQAAAGLISAVSYLVATLEEVPDARRTLWSVAQTIYKGTDGGAGKLKSFIREQGTENPAYIMASSFMAATDKAESGILSTVNNVLQAFNTASIKYITGGDGISVTNITRKPTAVFLRVLPKGNQSNKLASLFLAQHLAETLRQGDRSKLTPTYVVADEFHSIPKFDLVSGVELGRKYGLHYYMYVQSLTGFDAYSTKTENGKEAVLANADVKVLYKAGSVADAEYFERIGGKRTVLAGNVNTTTHSQGVTDSEGYSEREISNWQQGDLMQRDPYKDGVLVFTNITGEDKHNGKFEIPVPDVTKTPTAQNFPTFGSREHERDAMRAVEDKLDARTSKLNLNVAWTPQYEDDAAQDEQSSDDDIFGI